ncbi:hypothetical protein PUN4_700052 [Paraburkholderia unamae]|nr:hypothetical protein PUN4_700052 [Paraburkholderia unamae]
MVGQRLTVCRDPLHSGLALSPCRFQPVSVTSEVPAKPVAKALGSSRGLLFFQGSVSSYRLSTEAQKLKSLIFKDIQVGC